MLPTDTRTVNDLPPLMRSKDLAAALGMKVHTVNEWIRRGLVPASKIGRYYIVRREALLEFLRQQEQARASHRRRSHVVAGVLESIPRRRRSRAIASAANATLPTNP